ncbi:MAG: ABC transporter ATP-binding protein [Leucobacter sp.]
MSAGLEIRNLVSGYGELKIIRGLSLSCEPGQITVLLGRNGAGKTTTLKTVAGLLPAKEGEVLVFGEKQTGTAPKRVAAGMALVQEGKRIFRARTVEDNLRLGAYLQRRQRGFVDEGIESAYTRFPILKGKRNQAAGLLSGGQQQMLSIAQALMPKPKVLMLDEPSAGLAPAIVEEVFGSISDLKADGLCVLLVEQLIDNSLAIADRVAVLDRGTIQLESAVSELASWDVLREIYLGADVHVEKP